MYVSSPSDRSAKVSSGEAGPVDPAPRPKRRTFTAQYKLAIVEEYEQAPNGQKGAVLRREGLYSSHVIEWTQARDAGALSAETGSGAGQFTTATKSAWRTPAVLDEGMLGGMGAAGRGAAANVAGQSGT